MCVFMCENECLCDLLAFAELKLWNRMSRINSIVEGRLRRQQLLVTQ